MFLECNATAAGDSDKKTCSPHGLARVSYALTSPPVCSTGVTPALYQNRTKDTANLNVAKRAGVPCAPFSATNAVPGRAITGFYASYLSCWQASVFDPARGRAPCLFWVRV